MGEVMLAATLGVEGAERPVIVKTIRSEHKTDQSFNARFLDEARVQAQLEHPGVAQVFEATRDEDSGEPYVIVEHVDGRSLGDVRARALATGQAIEWHEAVAVCQLVAEALAHVHDRLDPQGRNLSIVHRDLSPQNVMVSYEGEVKIIDFGTARGENRRCHTVSGVVYAKPGYTAPEVANGDSGDFRVDLYALGVMLWELCAGRRFLTGDASDHMAAVAKNSRNLPAVAELAGAPAALDHVIEKLTSFDRDRRYSRSKQAARELALLLGKAKELESGERGVRARVQGLMARLFEGESAKMRREFQRLVAEARKQFTDRSEKQTPVVNDPQPLLEMREESDGMLPGTRYRLGREMGRGATSVVHQAEHVDLGRTVALKVVLPEHREDEEAGARIQREARVLSALALPGVVRLIDVGKARDGRPFSVLELCEGETLAARLERTQGANWREALELTGKLLDILDRVHAAGVVHRDVKPSNVVVGTDGDLTLLDFGISLGDLEPKPLETPAPARPTVAIFGTPEYMAPEQAARPDEVDARADIYAVGSILYELLTGRLPFVHDSAAVLLEQKTQGSPEAPSERAPARQIPREVDELVLTALARHASLRFASAAAMRKAITSALAMPETRRSRRRAAGFVAIAAAMLGAAGLLAAHGSTVGHSVRQAGADVLTRVGLGNGAPLAMEAPAAPPHDALDALGTAPTEAEPAASPTPAPAPDGQQEAADSEPLAPLALDAPTDAARFVVVDSDASAADGDAAPAVDSEPAAKPVKKKKVRRAEKKKDPSDSKKKARKKHGKKKSESRAEAP
jgi:serine/threonine-protein kinase